MKWLSILHLFLGLVLGAGRTTPGGEISVDGTMTVASVKKIFHKQKQFRIIPIAIGSHFVFKTKYKTCYT